jgi:ubiquinone/menaquinone biosynthesis C-methylase UbiE
LRCPNGHFFPFAEGTPVPVFASSEENANEYAITNAAEVHDNSLRWVFATFGVEEFALRERLMARLQVRKGQKILLTGAGAGNDIPYLVEGMAGEGIVYAQDIAKQMLLAGFERYSGLAQSSGVQLHFSVSDATSLPFVDGYFDAAYHFGGINLFPDVRKGIAEMNRVVRPGGVIVIGDEGIAPWLKDSEYGRMQIRNNPLYDYDPPLALLPESAKDVRLTWELGNCFFVIDFVVGDAPPSLNIDVPHIGTRGGTIRTRYYGQLEGVDPALRDKVYADAKELGLSRVVYIEALLRGEKPGSRN